MQTLGPMLPAVLTRPPLVAGSVAALAVVIAILLRLLLLRGEATVGPPASFPNFHLPLPLSSPGLTIIRSVALRHGLQRDLEAIPAIQHVGISLLGRQLHPKLQLRIEVSGDRDLAASRKAVYQALDRFSEILGSTLRATLIP